MKKFLLALLLLSFTSLASATDLGLTFGRDYSTPDRNAGGLVINQRVLGNWGVQGGFERFTAEGNGQNRYTVLGTYSPDLFKFTYASFSMKAGGAYIDNQLGADGYALVAGPGVTVPLTFISNSVSATVDFRHQWGQDRINRFNGNTGSVGLKYSF
jgi:hypothetical protein